MYLTQQVGCPWAYCIPYLRAWFKSWLLQLWASLPKCKLGGRGWLRALGSSQSHAVWLLQAFRGQMSRWKISVRLSIPHKTSPSRQYWIFLYCRIVFHGFNNLSITLWRTLGYFTVFTAKNVYKFSCEECFHFSRINAQRLSCSLYLGLNS